MRDDEDLASKLYFAGFDTGRLHGLAMGLRAAVQTMEECADPRTRGLAMHTRDVLHERIARIEAVLDGYLDVVAEP